MSIEWIKNKNKEKIYPVSHTDAILHGDSSNKTLSQHLSECDDKIAEIVKSEPALDFTEAMGPGFQESVDSLNTEIDNLKSDLSNEINRAIKKDNELEELFTLPTQEAVSKWLNEHPEATTTVQDGSLEENKFTDALRKKALKEYVTPEMYGAVGDGVADDSDAIQNAVNSGLPVYASKNYYISKPIVISKGTTTLKVDGVITYSGSDSAVIVTTSFCYLYFNQIKSSGNGIEFRPSGITTHADDNCTNNILICNRIYCNGTSGIGLYLNCISGIIQFSKFNINSIQGKWDTRLIDGIKIVATKADSRYCNGNIFDVHSISFCNNAIVGDCVSNSCFSNVFNDLHFEQNNVSLDLNNMIFRMSACYDESTPGIVKISENVCAEIHIIGAINDAHFDTSADITSPATSWHFIGVVGDANGNRICSDLYFTKYGIIAPDVCTPTYELTNLNGIMGCRHVGYLVPGRTYKVPAVKCSGTRCPLSYFEYVFLAAEFGSATFEFSDSVTKTVTWDTYSGIVRVYPSIDNTDYRITVTIN